MIRERLARRAGRPYVKTMETDGTNRVFCHRLAAGMVAILISGGLVTLAATPAHADTELEAEETDETINKTVKSLRETERKAEKSQSNLKRLESRHRDTQFQKRTGTPFRSDRTLRHDLRRNEARQGWEKHENRRLEHSIQKRQRELRSQTDTWRRAR